jgi:hypothetical protein
VIYHDLLRNSTKQKESKISAQSFQKMLRTAQRATGKEEQGFHHATVAHLAIQVINQIQVSSMMDGIQGLI